MEGSTSDSFHKRYKTSKVCYGYEGVTRRKSKDCVFQILWIILRFLQFLYSSSKNYWNDKRSINLFSVCIASEQWLKLKTTLKIYQSFHSRHNICQMIDLNVHSQKFTVSNCDCDKQFKKTCLNKWEVSGRLLVALYSGT